MPPPPGQMVIEALLRRVAVGTGDYPVEAYEFVQRGLVWTVAKIHGKKPEKDKKPCHVSGQQLCHGLREFALYQWGPLARTVLRRWNVYGTLDFGRIVFALIEHKILNASPTDCLEDFRNVYDFTTLDSYRIRVP